ncbi:protein IN CHLOROPLAST ATPASE BIOGENESIS, chloroplastic-like isoform X5 [Rhodamnia argentea]|uniref:Protein IN CHLOROPLAST ATPASE BIOGENESIS, chloroplastic-like isoform X5 n=1 Tax=Rhodamnia argentea TaxID=178133 RepID=A0ABM3GV58_9MYRT|nr:protein IN CHLOROPLAST ATPASE BIOGENESIS, chloroplastic-like isoform X5 [Rhodamnia argentea]
MLCRASRAASRRPPLLLRGGASRLRSCSSVSSSAPDDPVPIPAANTVWMLLRSLRSYGLHQRRSCDSASQTLASTTASASGERRNDNFTWIQERDGSPCHSFSKKLLRGYYCTAKMAHSSIWVDQFIHRILLEEDTLGSLDASNKLLHASAGARRRLYKEGEFTKSKISNLDIYLLKKVGLFPDILERKAMNHFENGDDVSALVTAEFYTKKENFPGFARPFVFNAVLLQKVGHFLEAKDAARGALKLPWWTLGCKYEDVAEIAEWEDEQIERIKEKITERGREEDLMKGKPPAQIALDEAAFLMDLASVKGTWDDSVDRIGKCYEEAGLPDIAQFVRYQE